MTNAERCKKYYSKHREQRLKKVKEYSLANSYKIQKYQKEYRELHKVERNEYLKRRRFTSPSFKLLTYLRNRLNSVVASRYKSLSSLQLMGCSIEVLRDHLEKQFTPGMSWSNYGKWHIDHIKPCASFDLTKSEEQQKCFHYTNLQPLWALENLKKGSKVL